MLAVLAVSAAVLRHCEGAVLSLGGGVEPALALHAVWSPDVSRSLLGRRSEMKLVGDGEETRVL